jgi:eukaryotic-like serine/threonine-protein kinase
MVDDVFGIMGTTLAGTFHVEEVIAEGGFGVVYRAEHVAFRAPVALKCLKIPGTISPGQSEEFVENFREEAEILFHLSAQIPEVVRPLHADAMTLEDGTFVPFIAMEWIEGKPLDSIIILREEDGLPPLALRAVLKMLSPIAHALNQAHKFQVPGGAMVSVTHCDLKPENIVVTERDSPTRAKILDFGIAKARDMMRQNVGRITDSEEARPFTPSYGAPEQWVPKRYGQTGPWTDVWGLALTLVECLSGRPPIEGDMHAMMGTCLDTSRRPSPRIEGVDVSDAVESVFNQALAVDPRDRFQDIESFWTALEDAEGVPSTFERARSRRERPTYDYVEEQAEEFSELELEDGHTGEGDAMFGTAGYVATEEELSASDFVAPEIPDIAPAPASRGRKISRQAMEAMAADPYEADLPLDDVAPSAPVSSVNSDPFSASELDLSSESPAGSGSFDLDLGGPESAAPSRPRAGVASGTWAAGDLSRSGAHPQLSRSGAHQAAALIRTGSHPQAPAHVSAHLEPPTGEPTLFEQLRKPLMIFGAALVVIGADIVLVKVLGEPFKLGPIRLRYFAAILAVVALVVGFLSLLGDSDD